MINVIPVTAAIRPLCGAALRRSVQRNGKVCITTCGGPAMWEFWGLELLRLGVAFGIIGLVIWFWYWLMDSLGTF
jgi:hypothetical protein